MIDVACRACRAGCDLPVLLVMFQDYNTAFTLRRPPLEDEGVRPSAPTIDSVGVANTGAFTLTLTPDAANPGTSEAAVGGGAGWQAGIRCCNDVSTAKHNGAYVGDVLATAAFGGSCELVIGTTTYKTAFPVPAAGEKLAGGKVGGKSAAGANAGRHADHAFVAGSCHAACCHPCCTRHHRGSEV